MTTSRRNASSVEMSDPVVTASYAPSDDASIGTSFMKSGSVYAKLFAKKAQVDVVETVEIHQNGLDEAHDVQPHGHDEMKHEGTSNGGIVRAKSVVEDEGGDEDDDEEYMPSEDGDSASEDEDTSDLEDEEMSMRGLLMPMATYARQLLFRETEDDEFDEQDSHLWSTPEEKRAWIDRFEAANREYEEQFGCRIDSAALPDVKRRLRRERRREAKYSLVLLAIAFAYMLRLWLGPRSAVVEPTAEGQTWKDPAAPVWWEGRTEDLVVRAVMWPRSVWTHFTELVRQREEVPVTQHKKMSKPHELEGEHTPKPTSLQDGSLDEEVVHPGKIANEPSLKIHEESVYIEVRDDSPVSSADVESMMESPRHSVEVEVEVVEVATEAVVVEMTEVKIDSLSPTDLHEAPHDDNIHHVISDVVEGHNEQPGDHHSDDTGVVLEKCWTEFHNLIKTKRDPDVKVAAVSACDQAVEVTQEYPSTQQWLDAHVMRGDLKSMLLQFADAHDDYRAALAQSAMPLTGQIEEKMMANLLIDLYQMKNGKDLVEVCQKALDSSAQGIRELASLWTRVSKGEVPVFEALKETRLRTVSRLQFDYGNPA